MKTTPEHDERIAKMTFASVYPHYVTKVERKGRTVEELHLVAEQVHFEQFFPKVRSIPTADLITGVICGYRIEEIENPLTRKTRYLDKLVDELAKGRPLEKILRSK